MSQEFDWDFESDPSFDAKAYEASVERYNAPRNTHECGSSCSDKLIPGYHEIEDIFDDFNLSSRQREIQFMEIVTARGRENKEKLLIRRFQSTVDGSYIIRMQSVNSLSKERMGEVRYESLEDADAYFNYCIDIFGFDKSLKVGLDSTDDLFEGLEDNDPFDFEDDPFDFDEDEDDEYEGLFD